MSVTAVFPTYLFHYDFLEMGIVNIDYLSSLKDEMDNMREKDNSGRVVSNANGWQSNDSCERNPLFFRVFREILNIANNDLLNFFRVNKSQVSISMGNCWANINDTGSWNRPHGHNGCWYSGVFYIDSSPEQGRLSFIDQDTKVVSDFPHAARHNSSHDINPWSGNLLLFPSGLIHMVEPNLTDRSRYSIAFNLNTDYIAFERCEFDNQDPRGDYITFELDDLGRPVYTNL